MDAATDLSRPHLETNLQTDVCVVGAGIAGLTTAYTLASEGLSVVVIDSGTIGSGETGRTTAHLSNALDDRYFQLEKLHGEKGARLAALSHTMAIDRIEATVAREEIRCDFERLDGYLFVPPGESTEVLEQELAAARRAGLTRTEMVERAPLANYNTGPCLRFPDQGQFHPLLYLQSLAKAFERSGGKIFCGTHAMEFQDGAAASAKTAGGFTVSAGALVVATNTPVNNVVAVHTKQAAYRTYAIGLRIGRETLPKALYWDTGDPYHYVRRWDHDEHGVLIVGGEDHKTGQEEMSEERFRSLEAWARTRVPGAGEVLYRWSGQVMEPVDSLAFIGRNPGDKNIYIATGDSGHGMTHGTIAGILITDLILGRYNEWSTLYDPGRISLRATAEFAKENLNVAAQYRDYATGGEIDDVAEIAPGSGAVMRDGLKKVAVYRDENGYIHQCSAVCPHLGGIVHWNLVEHSWDCPCHGSRFDATGNVINGPAISGLEPVHDPEPVRQLAT